MLTLCAYCGVPLDGKEKVNREHAVPQSLGGAVSPRNPLMVRVHEKHNTQIGRLIDASFARGWHGAMTRHWSARATIDPSTGKPIPLGPIAPKVQLLDDGREVDLWLVAPGFFAYHVHKPYPRGVFPQIGPPVGRHAGTYDAGESYVVITTERDPAWDRTAIASVRKTFEGAPVYLANILNPEENGFPAVPQERVELARLLVAKAATQNKGRFDLALPVEELLTARAALMFASCVLGDEYVKSDEARRLQRYVLEPDTVTRDTLGVFVRASHQLHGELGGTLDAFLQVPDHHTFLLKCVGDEVVVLTSWFGELPGLVVVSVDAERWRETVGDGLIVVYAPGRGRASDIVPFPLFIEWRNHDEEARLATTLGRAPPFRDRLDPSIEAERPPSELDLPPAS